METKTNCPVCGSELSVEINATGNNLPKKSPKKLPKDFPNGTSVSRSQMRLDALKAKGFDTSAFFAVNAVNGQEYIMKMVDGIPQAVREEDFSEMEKSILNAGTIPERRLFRQHIMAQVFRMLDTTNSSNGNFTECMKNLGYTYIWDMMLDEYKSQTKMFLNGDKESLEERRLFFDARLVSDCIRDYVKQVKKYQRTAHLYKNMKTKRYYIILFGKTLYIDDLSLMIGDWEKLADIAATRTMPVDSFSDIKNFMKTWIKPAGSKTMFEQPKEWQEAYKGAGAYFTLKNLIMFHDFRLLGCGLYALENPLKYIRKKAETCSGQGYVLLGFLKDQLRENEIDITAMRRRWRKEKMAKRLIRK